MHSTITISALGLAGIFVLGFVIGWVCGKARIGGSFNISVERADPASGSNPTFVFAKTVKTMSLKCQCGETWRFHETSGHPDQGSQPMPEGDSYTCPKCGRTIDLREIRKLQA